MGCSNSITKDIEKLNKDINKLADIKTDLHNINKDLVKEEHKLNNALNNNVNANMVNCNLNSGQNLLNNACDVVREEVKEVIISGDNKIEEMVHKEVEVIVDNAKEKVIINEEVVINKSNFDSNKDDAPIKVDENKQNNQENYEGNGEEAA